MSEDANHLYARTCLEHLGLKVQGVADEHAESRADYIASDHACSYIVEVKGPGEDEDFAEELIAHGKATRIQPDARTNPLSRKIRKAAKQMRATPAPADAFHVIALVTGEIDTRLKASQYVATLYGIENLFVLEGEELHGPTSCYYFTFSEFFELRDVEAALILTPSPSILCPNKFAHRSKEFTESGLYSSHRMRNEIVDPEAAEGTGKAFIANTDLDRHDEDGMLNFVQAKYSLASKPIVIRLQQIYQQIVIDKLPGATD